MDRKWWKEAVFYQIYPRSFYDSNGDGIGDLKGITEKLPYLKELGVTAVWICPFFKSPMKDNGYDISDYYDVNPEFGTIEDADELIRCANENGIKIIMDMVINHTSDQHRWFQEACRDRHSKYRNYYIFKDNIDGLADLRSNFGGSTWTQIEDGSWYFHSFAKEQPDLNWECEEMRQELYDMMNWWLDKGVSGFRMDAITFIKKDLSFPPMPSDGEDGRCDVGKCCLNRPGIDEFLHELKLNTYGRGDFVTVAETPGVPNEDLDRYIGRDGHFSMIFDFSYTDIDINPGDLWLHQRDWTIEEFKDKLFTNQRLVKKIGWAANYLENHDQPRSYQGGRTAYDDLLEAEKNRPSIKWSKGVFICYLLFGWLIKIGAVYRLYQSLGKTYLTVGEGGSELGIVRWKDVGIWLMSVIFWIGCFWCYYEFKAWMN